MSFYLEGIADLTDIPRFRTYSPNCGLENSFTEKIGHIVRKRRYPSACNRLQTIQTALFRTVCPNIWETGRIFALIRTPCPKRIRDRTPPFDAMAGTQVPATDGRHISPAIVKLGCARRSIPIFPA